MANRAQRAVARAADDRRAQIAVGTVAAAGVAVAGKVGLDRLRENGRGSDGTPSRSYRLRSGERPKQGIRRIARGRTDNALEQLEGAEEGAVHEARKDLKKLRSLLRLIRDDLGDSTYRRENRRFRDAGRLLSAARDAEVKVQTLDSLQERFAELNGDGLKAFRDRLEDERAAAAAAVEQKGDAVATSAAAIAQGGRGVKGWRLQSQGWELVGPGLVRIYRRGRKRMRQALDDPSAKNVHEWRKRSKDLWYHMRILRQAWPEVIGATADQAHELADLLGDHHDLEVLAADARKQRELFAESDGAEALARLAARRQEELLQQATGLGERLYAEKPKAFGRRFRAYWMAWRPT
jgi:CHAD domain-containing protein